ncbi:hypothetical protein [Deinococcus apachensis]|uniref:hypothetical protein n=1 Tax=Deinococcus apachensis TaxID=309886 RepID=UPI000367DBB4|nr:hypothetical protein [Deinococcus apachensis]
MTPRLGTAYFSSEVGRHFVQDLDDLACSGFQTVVFPLTEEQLTYSPRLFKDYVWAARDLGLSPVLSPWGLASCFGGEGLSAVSGRQDRLTAVDRWLELALNARPDAIMLDEPRDRLTARDLTPTLRGWAQRIRERQTPVWLCYERGRVPHASLLPLLSSLGTSDYDWRTTPEEQASATRSAAAEVGESTLASSHLWVRAFGVDRAHHSHALAALRAALASGVDDVLLWSYRGGEGRGCLASEEASRLWEELLEQTRPIARQ